MTIPTFSIYGSTISLRSGVRLFIDIIEASGFANFWVNSSEQICISYLNEKMQKIFVYLKWIKPFSMLGKDYLNGNAV